MPYPKIGFLVAFFAIALCSCSLAQNAPIRCLRVIKDIPLVNRDGSLIENLDFFHVYFNDDLVMYQFRYGYDSSINGKVLLAEYRDYFFIHRRGKPVGYSYAPHWSEFENKPFGVDSTLKKFALQGMQWHELAKEAPGFSGDSAGVYKEIFAGPTEFDSTKNDSIIFYFSKRFQDVDFSLSKKLDSLKGLKLYKIRLLYPDAYSAEHKVLFPKRETRFEIQEVAVEKQGTIRQYFDRFRREHMNE